MQVERHHTNIRKAISPLIATLILIAITITGGVVVYRLFYATAGSISTNVHVSISDASASQVAGFTVAVHNDGTTKVDSLGVKVAGPNNTSSSHTEAMPSIGALNPGVTGSSVMAATGTFPIIAGTYVFTVTAYSGAGNYTTTLTVTAGP